MRVFDATRNLELPFDFSPYVLQYTDSSVEASNYAATFGTERHHDHHGNHYAIGNG